jgi:hypothetical protein
MAAVSLLLLLTFLTGATAIDYCGYVSSFLPSECRCTNVNRGFDLQCSVNFFNLDNVGLDLNISPCGHPAEAVLDFTDTKMNIHHKLAGLQAGKDLKWPVPGLSLDFPEVGEVGMVVDFGFEGNADSLSIKIGLDACGKVAKFGICGSQLHVGLPLEVFSHTFQFTHFCTNSSLFQPPLGQLLERPKPRPDPIPTNTTDKPAALLPRTTPKQGNSLETKCSYASYSQCDAKWGDVKLGTSTNTICHAGCAMTSVAMFLQSAGNNINPLQLNEFLISDGGYASKDLIIWSAVDAQFHVNFQGFNSNPTVDGIKQSLDDCHGLIANVRDGSHWVLITGYVSDETFNVHDPGFNTQTYDLSDISQYATYVQN